MSFQDVGKRNSSRQPVNATMMSKGNTGNSSSLLSSALKTSASVFASMSIPAATVTTQISDSITQYHVRFTFSLQDGLCYDGVMVCLWLCLCLCLCLMNLIQFNLIDSILQFINLKLEFI
jgi:hypothetical protein